MKIVTFYILYFLGLPVILIYFYSKLRHQSGFAGFLSSVNGNRGKKSSERTEKAKKKSQRTKIIFSIVLVLFLLSWHFITADLVDLRFKGEVKYGGGGMYTENPVVVSLGPTYNGEKVVRTMKEKETRWLPDQVEKVVALDKIANSWGRIGVYRTYDQRYVITITYLSPWPVVRSYGFQYVETEEGKKIIKKERKTVFYPLDPGTVDETAKL